MSYHINAQDYQCKNCNNIFIPYRKGLTCNICSTSEESDGYAYDFIDQIINSMKAHKLRYGMYFPGAWFINSKSDDIQKIVFNIFDAMDRDPSLDFNKIIEIVKTNNRNSPQGTATHILDILNILNERRNEFKDPKPNKRSKNKIIRFFRSLHTVLFSKDEPE